MDRHVMNGGQADLKAGLPGIGYRGQVSAPDIAIPAQILTAHGFAAQGIAHVLRGRDMIAALVGYLAAVVERGVQALVPVGLPGVDAIAALPGRHLEAGAVEEIELELGSDHINRVSAMS